MQTKIINLYKFSELSAGIQEKLIEDEYNRSIDALSDIVSDYFRAQVDEFFGSGLKVYYSLNHCQGDGVAFEGEIDLELLLESFKERFSRNELRLLRKCTAARVSHYGRYYHENSFEVALEVEQYSYSREYRYIDDLKDCIEAEILSILKDFSLKLKEEGYREFHGVDEFSRGTLEEKDCMYTITGVREYALGTHEEVKNV